MVHGVLVDEVRRFPSAQTATYADVAVQDASANASISALKLYESLLVRRLFCFCARVCAHLSLLAVVLRRHQPAIVAHVCFVGFCFLIVSLTPIVAPANNARR